MKRVAAIILSLTLIWLQAMASAQTICAPAPVPCGCCTPKKTCGCVAQAAPDAVPVPASPASPSAQIDFTAVLAKVLTWTLPAAASAIISSCDCNPAPLSAIPLFQRNCALLI